MNGYFYSGFVFLMICVMLIGLAYFFQYYQNLSKSIEYKLRMRNLYDASINFARLLEYGINNAIQDAVADGVATTFASMYGLPCNYTYVLCEVSSDIRNVNVSNVTLQDVFNITYNDGRVETVVLNYTLVCYKTIYNDTTGYGHIVCIGNPWYSLEWANITSSDARASSFFSTEFGVTCNKIERKSMWDGSVIDTTDDVAISTSLFAQLRDNLDYSIQNPGQYGGHTGCGFGRVVFSSAHNVGSSDNCEIEPFDEGSSNYTISMKKYITRRFCELLQAKYRINGTDIIVEVENITGRNTIHYSGTNIDIDSAFSTRPINDFTILDYVTYKYMERTARYYEDLIRKYLGDINIYCSIDDVDVTTRFIDESGNVTRFWIGCFNVSDEMLINVAVIVNCYLESEGVIKYVPIATTRQIYVHIGETEIGTPIRRLLTIEPTNSTANSTYRTLNCTVYCTGNKSLIKESREAVAYAMISVSNNPRIGLPGYESYQEGWYFEAPFHIATWYNEHSFWCDPCADIKNLLENGFYDCTTICNATTLEYPIVCSDVYNISSDRVGLNITIKDLNNPCLNNTELCGDVRYGW